MRQGRVTGHRAQHLRGRRAECTTLERLTSAARSGRGQVVVLLGEAGIGKTALLDFVAERAKGFRTARLAGVESEMELAYAGLQQLCGPLLDCIDRLPAPQRDALDIALSAAAPGRHPTDFWWGWRRSV
jgi:AAA ATPase domain